MHPRWSRPTDRARTARRPGGNIRRACPARRCPPARGTTASCPPAGPSRPDTNAGPPRAPVLRARESRGRWSPGQPPAGGLAPTFLADPVGVAVAPALLVGLVQAGLDRLDLAGVMLDVQSCGADPGIRVLLEPLHLAAEPLIQREPGGARADAVQRPGPGLRVRGAQAHQHGIRIRRALAGPPFVPG